MRTGIVTGAALLVAVSCPLQGCASSRQNSIPGVDTQVATEEVAVQREAEGQGTAEAAGPERQEAAGQRERVERDDEGREEAEGEKKKRHSGRSYLDETVVAREPSPSATASGFDAERVWSGYDDWEPAVGVDPSGERIYQMTTRYGGPKACAVCADPALIVRASTDGGATWGQDDYLIMTGRNQNDPMADVAEDGVVYAALLHDYMPGVKLLTSTNFAESWTEPVLMTPLRGQPKWSDRPVLAISQSGEHVYVAFNASDSYVSASHDYGRTFGDPVKTNTDRRYWFHSSGAVAPNGDVYFIAADYSADYTGDANINVIRSTDGGRAWDTTRVDVSAEPPDCRWAEGCYFGFFGPTAGVAVDASGRVLLAYNAGLARGDPQRLFVRTSVDGERWSDRIQLSVDDPEVSNAFPAVAAGPTPGDFRVVWQDDRNGPTEAWNTWYRRSTSGGSSWGEALRLSDQGSGAPYKRPEGYRFPYGDYLEIDVDDQGVNHIIWGEGDSYTGPGGTWYTRGQ